MEEQDNQGLELQAPDNYTGDDIRTLDWKEHIRRRPGMYIGKLGDGSASDDGIYVLLKEVLDNAIDEFMMGFGKQITVDITETGTVSVRDFGRGIPLEKLEDVNISRSSCGYRQHRNQGHRWGSHAPRSHS